MCVHIIICVICIPILRIWSNPFLLYTISAVVSAFKCNKSKGWMQSSILVALSSDSCFLLYSLAVEEEYLWAEHCCCSGRSYIDTTIYKDIGTRYQNRGDAVLSHNYDESVFALYIVECTC